MMRVASTDTANVSIAGKDALNVVSISEVLQFPTRNQITLGGLQGLSCWVNFELTLAIGGKCKAGADVFFGEVREILENLFVAHAASQVLEDVIDRDAEATDTRLTASLARLDRNDLGIVHGFKLRQFAGKCKFERRLPRRSM